MFKTQWQKLPGNRNYEKKFGKSQTVPDMSLTVRELFLRYTTGGVLPPENIDGGIDENFEGDNLELVSRYSNELETIRKKQAEKARLMREKEMMLFKQFKDAKAIDPAKKGDPSEPSDDKFKNPSEKMEKRTND